jgi:hypothetical protein
MRDIAVINAQLKQRRKAPFFSNQRKEHPVTI